MALKKDPFKGLVDFFLNRQFSTPTLGFARSLFAFSACLTLVFNPPGILFETALIQNKVVPFDWTNFFHLARYLGPWGGHALGIPIYLIILSGFRPRWTGILHAWIANSFMRTTTLGEGGDQIHAILTLLLIPITLADSRKWHWSKPSPSNIHSDFSRITCTSAWIFIQIQMSVLYLSAAVTKCAVSEWQVGTAVYYWSKHPYFGVSPLLERPIDFLFQSPWISYAFNWGTLIIELLLFAAVLARTRFRRVILFLGFALHIGIFFIHGLTSFVLVMFAALLLYLGPVSVPTDRDALAG